MYIRYTRAAHSSCRYSYCPRPSKRNASQEAVIPVILQGPGHQAHFQVGLELTESMCITSSNILVSKKRILPIPGEAKAKAMPGRLYIHTK